MNIKCPYHGIFTQESNSHIQGTGCPICSKYKTSRFGGMSNIIGLDNEVVHFYLINFKNKQYNFLKIGLTSRTIAKRFSYSAYYAYEKEIILDLLLPAKFAIELERYILFYFYNYRYYISSEDSFKGCTELLNYKVLEKVLFEIGNKLAQDDNEVILHT